MMSNIKDSLRSLMHEASLNPKIQNELLLCVETGKPFPYIPKTLIKPKKESFESPATPNLKLPGRPIQRPKSTIERLGDYERDQFRPNPSKSKHYFLIL